MEDIGSTKVDLPSQGKFYDSSNPLSFGEVEVRYMTAADEDILTDQGLLQKGIAIDKLIESVVVQDNVDIDEMLVGDKGAVILATRMMSYGPNYQFKIECPDCGEENQESIDLGEVDFKDIPLDEIDDGQREFDVDLPVSKKVATVRLLKHKHEKEIRQELKRVKRNQTGGKTLKGPQVGTQITTRLKKYIIALDGERNNTEINRFVETMPAGDSHAIRKFIRKINPDIDLSFYFV